MSRREFQSDPLEPNFKTQLDEYGKPEKVDISVFTTRVLCQEPGCVQIRFVRNQDRPQTHYCKPHARKHRLESRARRARANRALRNATKESAE